MKRIIQLWPISVTRLSSYVIVWWTCGSCFYLYTIYYFQIGFSINCNLVWSQTLSSLIKDSCFALSTLVFWFIVHCCMFHSRFINKPTKNIKSYHIYYQKLLLIHKLLECQYSFSKHYSNDIVLMMSQAHEGWIW